MTWINLEGPVYWTLFVTAFLAVAAWESWLPWRKLALPAEHRWGRHGLLLLVSALIQAAVYRVSPVALASVVAGNRYGLLNKDWAPLGIRCVLAILVIDLGHYLTHRAFHSFSWLWRVHEIHHSDADYDVSTAVRFHPLEVLLTQGFNLGLILLLAPPAAAVFFAEMLAAVVNIFVHANASLTPGLEQALRKVFVTPGMHRIHHSVEEAEQSANLGQAFSWWDRLFGTYLGNAAADDPVFRTGMKGQVEGEMVLVGEMLKAPFRARRRELVSGSGRR